MAETSFNISMHGCTAVRVDMCSRTNSNHMRLEIQGEEAKGGALLLDLYDLPAEITKVLMRAFADDKTRDYSEAQERAA